MKKICAVGFALLMYAGCTFNQASDEESDSKGSGRYLEARGFVQRGFSLKAEREVAGLCTYTFAGLHEPEYLTYTCGDAVEVDSITGYFVARHDRFREKYSKVSASSGYLDFVDAVGNRGRLSDMGLSAVVDLSSTDTVYMSYLTSLATELIEHYYGNGMDFQSAVVQGNTKVLQNYGLPEDLVDLSSYSIWGSGEGDAMTLAMSILFQEYYRLESNSTAFRSVEIDTATGELVDKGVIEEIGKIAYGYVAGDKLDSLRALVESHHPQKGKVANYEKYISMYFADYYKVDRCTADNQGEKIYLTGEKRKLVCDDGVWRATKWSDYSIDEIFNPDIEYGKLTDPRDGREYRTIKRKGFVWMAENLKYADSNATENLKGQTGCFNNEEDMCEALGRLYTWVGAMDLPVVYLDSFYNDTAKYHQGICPEGWHVPNESDIRTLDIEQEDFSLAWSNSDNSSGLSLLMTGYGSYNDPEYEPKTPYSFYGLGQTLVLWDSEAESYGAAGTVDAGYQPESYYTNSSFERHDRHDLASVRCVQDDDF